MKKIIVLIVLLLFIYGCESNNVKKPNRMTCYEDDDGKTICDEWYQEEEENSPYEMDGWW